MISRNRNAPFIGIGMPMYRNRNAGVGGVEGRGKGIGYLGVGGGAVLDPDPVLAPQGLLQGNYQV